LSTADGLVGDVTSVQQVPAVDDERNAALAVRMSLLASCNKSNPAESEAQMANNYGIGRGNQEPD
jgi:hypothetical protein